jgi:hypothetical protein
MQRYLDIFNELKASRAADFQEQHGLTTKTGFGLDAAIFKLLKPAWTTDAPGDLLNTNGVFFSIWVDPACEAKGIARYNLHAKKLRFIKGEDFAARDFARSFRALAQGELSNWPHCSFPKGPITLFEGHVPLDAATLRAETSELIDRFSELCPLIDQLLAD